MAAYLYGFQRRMWDLKNQKLFLLLKPRIMNPNKEFRGTDTEERNEFQR